MEKIDEALDAEWLSPEDLVEIDDEEAPRVSDIRELRAPRAPAELVSVEVQDTEADVREMGAPAPSRPKAHARSRSHTLAGLARLTLFFLVGLGLGSIFALGVATALELRRAPVERAPASVDPRTPAMDSSANVPELGEPGRAL